MLSDGHVTPRGAASRRRSRSLRRLLATALPLAATALIVAACGSSSSGGSGNGNSANKAATSYGTTLYGTLPPAGTPVKGGTITIAQLAGTTPTYIFPIVPGADTSTSTIEFISDQFLPLYWGPYGAKPAYDPSLSLADGPPVASNGNKTFTVKIKPGFKWANGAPVDANDMVFEVDLLKAAITESPANWGQFVPGGFPSNVVSATAPSQYTFQMTLNASYNDGYVLYNMLQDTNNVFPLPSTAWNIAAANGPHLDYTNPANAKKIYDFLNKAGASVSTFASNPLWKDVDGAFKLKDFSATNSSYDLVPNPTYGGSPKPAYDDLSVQTYTSATAQLNAFKAGTLDIVGLDPSQLAQSASLKSAGASVYGGPGFGWFGGIINFKDTADHFDKIITQTYARAAIMHLINDPGIIQGVYKNAAVPQYGPVPSSPTSNYTPANAVTPPYPYSPTAAVALLKSHGWKVVPNGQTTCAKAGSGAGECGPGIPAGTPFTFTWANQPEATATTGVLESEALASEAKQAAGININLQTKTFNFLTANYNDQNPAAAKYTNDWGVNNFGGIYQDYYPTQDGIDNAGGGFNLGDYNDPTAAKLINDSVHSGNPDAVKTEAAYLTTNLPAFFFPNADILYAVSKKVGGPATSWLVLTQQAEDPQYWYLTK